MCRPESAGGRTSEPIHTFVAPRRGMCFTVVFLQIEVSPWDWCDLAEAGDSTSVFGRSTDLPEWFTTQRCFVFSWWTSVPSVQGWEVEEQGLRLSSGSRHYDTLILSLLFSQKSLLVPGGCRLLFHSRKIHIPPSPSVNLHRFAYGKNSPVHW